MYVLFVPSVHTNVFSTTRSCKPIHVSFASAVDVPLKLKTTEFSLSDVIDARCPPLLTQSVSASFNSLNALTRR